MAAQLSDGNCDRSGRDPDRRRRGRWTLLRRRRSEMQVGGCQSSALRAAGGKAPGNRHMIHRIGWRRGHPDLVVHVAFGWERVQQRNRAFLRIRSDLNSPQGQNRRGAIRWPHQQFRANQQPGLGSHLCVRVGQLVRQLKMVGRTLAEGHSAERESDPESVPHMQRFYLSGAIFRRVTRRLPGMAGVPDIMEQSPHESCLSAERRSRFHYVPGMGAAPRL